MKTEIIAPHRKIIHIDMDAFFASVEQRDNPELRGKPVAVGGGKERGVVAAASYEARKYGVKSAMPSKIAYEQCPHLIFVKPRFEAYKKASQHIREIFKQHTDLIEPLSLDEAYLDVTENKLGLLSATQIAQQIKADIKTELNLIASAGISINKFLAKTASDVDKPDGLYVIPPENIIDFIEKMEINRFFGIGKVTTQKLYKKGIFTGKDLKAHSLENLKNWFGKSGSYYYNICRGIDNRAVNPNRIRKSLGAERTFEIDLRTSDDLFLQLDKISEIVTNRLKKANVSGKTITLKVKYSNFNQITRSKTIVNPIADLDLIKKMSKRLMEEIEENLLGIRLLGITVSNFINMEKEFPEGKQLTLEF